MQFTADDRARALRSCGKLRETWTPHEGALTDETGARVEVVRKRAASEAWAHVDGSPVTPDHREIDPDTGMQKGYVVLSAEERAKGFVRPVRRKYVHTKCGVQTVMGLALAETYARDPHFYSGTFCVGCRTHFPVGENGEFIWGDGSNQKVGT